MREEEREKKKNDDEARDETKKKKRGRRANVMSIERPNSVMISSHYDPLFTVGDKERDKDHSVANQNRNAWPPHLHGSERR